MPGARPELGDAVFRVVFAALLGVGVVGAVGWASEGRIPETCFAVLVLAISAVVLRGIARRA